jgi:hypothetical protein
MTTSATYELYYDPWHADLDEAVFSSSSAVRGWDNMPARV